MKHSHPLLKKYLALGLSLCLLGGCVSQPPAASTPAPTPSAASGAEATAAPVPTQAPAPTAKPEPEVRVALLKGPTGLGGALLMQSMDGPAEHYYSFEVLSEPTQAVAALTKGEVDMAAVPTNLASTLYHKLNGGVQLLCLNTLGVLHILENGDTVHCLEDLKGKTLHAFGQGANPEYVLNCLLEKNGLEPGKDVTVQWYADSSELAAKMAGGDMELCMLPVPAATTVLVKNDKVRSALDLNDAWEEAEVDGVLTMGCMVVRREFAQAHPQAVESFLAEYGSSIAAMGDPGRLEEAAKAAVACEIIPNEAIAKRAIPDANLCFLTGDEMMDGIQGYYQVLFAADPASIGGSIPDGAFYYTGK